jgi:hypothetical protein
MYNPELANQRLLNELKSPCNMGESEVIEKGESSDICPTLTLKLNTVPTNIKPIKTTSNH